MFVRLTSGTTQQHNNDTANLSLLQDTSVQERMNRVGIGTGTGACVLMSRYRERYRSRPPREVPLSTRSSSVQCPYSCTGVSAGRSMGACRETRRLMRRASRWRQPNPGILSRPIHRRWRSAARDGRGDRLPQALCTRIGGSDRARTRPCGAPVPNDRPHRQGMPQV
jgi:hypothetical protein